MMTGPSKMYWLSLIFNSVTNKTGHEDEYSLFVLSVAERSGAYMPLFNGDSYLQLKGLHLYKHDLR